MAGVAAQGGRRRGWAAAQAEFGGGALWWSSKRLDSANWLGVVLRQCTKGQEGRNFNGGVKSNRRRSSPALVSERNSRRGVTRSGAKELEDVPEVEAEPVRSLDGAQVRRGGRTLAAHGALRGGARWLRRG